MTDLLIKLFIKDYKNTSSARVREKYGKLAGLTGIATNLLLFIIKIIVGTISGSISVTADAINNLSDSGSSFVTLMGFKLSGKPADAKHPYGHGRMEYISGLIVSFIIILLGFQLIQSSFDKIIHPQEGLFSLWTVGVLVVSILLKLWQCLFYRRTGRLIDSLSLRTAGTDSRNDILATSTVLLGLLFTRLTSINLDGYMGAAVALFIMVSGIKLVGETISPLLGSAPKRELVDEICEKVLSYEGIIGIHDLTVHSYGPSECFASLHCEVPAEQDVMLSHDIIDNIEGDFLRERGIHMVIHLDPVITGDEKTNMLKEQVEGIVSGISEQVSIHDFRVVWSISHTNVLFDVTAPFEFRLSDEELTERISQEIKKLSGTYFVKVTIDHC
ncbi:MAG: cation diffusion facilitator family transporter [Eubacteriales bacterium]